MRAPGGVTVPAGPPSQLPNWDDGNPMIGNQTQDYALLDSPEASPWVPKRNRAVRICWATGIFLLATVIGSILSASLLSPQGRNSDLQEAADAAVYRSFPQSVDEDIDFSIDPCNNFYEFSCGRWINDTVIPADKSDVSLAFDAVSDGVDEELQELYEYKFPEDSEFRKVHDWYQSCINLTLIEERGSAPLIPYLKKIDSVTGLG